MKVPANHPSQTTPFTWGSTISKKKKHHGFPHVGVFFSKPNCGALGGRAATPGVPGFFFSKLAGEGWDLGTVDGI